MNRAAIAVLLLLAPLAGCSRTGACEYTGSPMCMNEVEGYVCQGPTQRHHPGSSCEALGFTCPQGSSFVRPGPGGCPR